MSKKTEFYDLANLYSSEILNEGIVGRTFSGAGKGAVGGGLLGGTLGAVGGGLNRLGGDAVGKGRNSVIGLTRCVNDVDRPRRHR